MSECIECVSTGRAKHLSIAMFKRVNHSCLYVGDHLLYIIVGEETCFFHLALSHDQTFFILEQFVVLFEDLSKAGRVKLLIIL
jgi:hypothetical protein